MGPFILGFFFYVKSPPPEKVPLRYFKAFLMSSQNTSAVGGYLVVIAIEIKRLDTFNYSSATLFHLTSKPKLAGAEYSGYMGLN